MERQLGYYWIFNYSEWIIAKYIGCSYWHLAGNEKPIDEKEIQKINENQLKYENYFERLVDFY